jgi:hypothetical protein
VLEPSGGSVAVHARAGPVKQDRPSGSVADGPVDSPGDSRGSGTSTILVPLPTTRSTPMTMLLAQVGNVGGAGFEDP